MKPLRTPLNLYLNETFGVPDAPEAPGVQALLDPRSNELADLVIPAVINIDLTNAQTLGNVVGSQYDIAGNVLIVTGATDSTVAVSLNYHSTNAHTPIAIGKNYFLAGFDFRKFFLSWTAQAGKTIQLTVIKDPNPAQLVRVQ